VEYTTKRKTSEFTPIVTERNLINGVLTEILTVLRRYAKYTGPYLRTFQDNLSVPSWTALHWRMEPIFCPETAVELLPVYEP